MKFFSQYPIISFTSDASIDFTPTDFDAPLSQAQQQYLRQQTGFDIPQVFWRKQIHGDDILIASKSAQGCPDADAAITDQKNLSIAIRTADCVPVFIYDPTHHAIGLAHAGWKGTHQQIAAKTIQRMQDKYGSQCYDLQVALGPSIRCCCYAVGEEFKAYFSEDMSERNGLMYVDVVSANRRQIQNLGVPAENIFDSGVCTHCNLNYFSYRREADKAGRMISLMMLL